MPGSNPLAPFQFSLGGDQFGPHLNTIGLPYAVVNKNALAASTDPDNPFGLGTGLDTYGNNVVLVTNPGFTYLDLAMIASSTAAPTITTALKVRAFGMPNELPINGAPPYLPHQYDTTANRWPNPLDTNPAANNNSTYWTSTWKVRTQGIWVPLTHPTSGDHEQTFSTSFSINTTGGVEFVDMSTNILSLVNGPIYYTAGCTKIVVLVSQAAAITNAAAAMVLGRLIK